MSPYRASCAVVIQGPLDVTALEAAVRDAVERYEILRTTFRSLEEVRIPLQVVGGHPPSLDLAPDRAPESGAAWTLEEEMRCRPSTPDAVPWCTAA